MKKKNVVFGRDAEASGSKKHEGKRVSEKDCQTGRKKEMSDRFRIEPMTDAFNQNEERRYSDDFEEKKRKKTITVVLCIAAVVLIVIGVYAVKLIDAYNDIKEVVADVQYKIPETYDLSLNAVDGYINILLLGSDSRDVEAMDKTRTDMVMIASINKESNEVKLTSIYRDTYLKLGNTYQYDKLTHACFYGGPELALKTVNQALDLDIEKFALVNFKAVADVVDAVGGIEINVEQYELEQLNVTIFESAEAAGRKTYELVDGPGVHILDGPQAVAYGRIRYNVGDDFKRTERMRTVVTCVLEKLKNMDLDEIKEIINIVKPSVRMNLNMDDILGLAYRIPKYTIITSAGWPYSVVAGWVGGTSYVVPNSLRSNVIELHRELFGREGYLPSDTSNAISNEIFHRVSTVQPENVGSSGELPQEGSDAEGNNPGTPPGSGGTDPGTLPGSGGTDPGTTPPGGGGTEPGTPPGSGGTEAGTTPPGAGGTEPGTPPGGGAEPGTPPESGGTAPEAPTGGDGGSSDTQP